MPDETKTETVEQKVPEQKPVEKPVEQVPETIESLKAKLAEAEHKAQNKAEEAERHFKKLSKLEQEEAKRKEAEMTELEKANKRAEELEKQLQARELADKKRTIAEKVGLPPALAVRLQGTADEEIEADAKALLESLPKPPEPQKKPSQIIPTANPNNAQQGETEVQRKARIFGEKVDIFDPKFMQEHGGGVYFNEPSTNKE